MAPAVKDHAYPELAGPQLLPLPPPPIKTRLSRHWVRLVLLAAVVIALAVVVELWRIHSQNAVSYETVAVERGSVQASVTATGTVNAVVDVQVGSQVSGNIKALYADFNTKVTKGQLVALIDPQVFQTQVDQAQSGAAPLQSAVVTNQQTDNFEIYLPNWLARHNKEIFGTLFVVNEFIVLWFWLR